jgi:uncharacterized membrane protein YfcA
MGGGALLTPILILVFGINPGTAVSSDLLTSLIMRPVGSVVHVRRGTVFWPLVGWLVVGSVPAGFAGVLVLRFLGNSKEVSHDVELAIGAALILAAAAIAAKTLMARRAPLASDEAAPAEPPRVKPLPTVGIGIVGGLMVGMTSVGSGSLMMVLLLILYPGMSTRNLVGTDLVQAVPLIGAAALGHALFGHISLGLTGSLLLGSIPGVYLGARLSSVARDVVLRPTLVVVLTGTSLKLLGMRTDAVLWSVGSLVVVGLAVWQGWAAGPRVGRKLAGLWRGNDERVDVVMVPGLPAGTRDGVGADR